MLTQVPCDSPFFIRTQQSYLKAWYYFLSTNSQPYKFFVNPSPQSIDDLTMNKQRIEMWIDGPVKCTPEVFHINGSFIFSRDHIKQNQFNQNNFLIPFLSGNEGFVNNLVVADFPQFKLMNLLAHRMTVQQVRQAFDDWIESATSGSPTGRPEDIIGGDKEFDFEFRNFEHFIKPKCAYFSELLKQSLIPSLNVEKPLKQRVLALVDKNMLEFLSEHWEQTVRLDRKDQKKVVTVNNLSTFYERSPEKARSDESYDTNLFEKKTGEDLDEVLNDSANRIDEGSEYFDKLVMLDFMYANPITHYFIKFKRFPYPLQGSSSARYLRDIDNMLVVWYYFYDKYQKQVHQAVSQAKPQPKKPEDTETSEYTSNGLIN